MNRRHFLKTGLRASLGAAAMATGIPALAQAAGKTLVVIFQRGGCDGLNTLVPHGDDEYYRLRPTIGVARPGQTNGAIDIDGYFGLHPSLQAFQPIMDSGHLAFMPSVQYPDPDRSHFESMEYIEQGVPNTELTTGWLNRFMDNKAGDGGLRAATFDGELDKSMRGPADVVTISNLRNFNLGIGGDAESSLIARLDDIYGQPANPDTGYRRLTHNAGKIAMEYLGVVEPLDVDNYTPENGAAYPDTTYGRRLSQIAHLIKANAGLQIATTSLGGWDTHDDQGDGDPDGSHSRRLSQFGDGIGALYTDLGTERMRNTVILTMTEFGRTAEENGSRGTDHGEGSCWFAVSAADNFVAGQHGEWPGLDSSQLSRERYLQWTVDYRDIMGDVLRGHLGATTLEPSLPGHNWNPLGLFNPVG